MTSTVRADGLEDRGPEFLWHVPQKPVAVRFPFPLVDRLGNEAVEQYRSLDSRGSEIGGVLFGQVTAGDPAVVHVDEYRLVDCDHSMGPLYRLSEADLQRIDGVIQQAAASGLEAVGFFRSHTRRGFGIGPDDLAVMRTRFKSPHHIALLVRSSGTKIPTGAVFIRENGEIASEASYQEFPFVSSMLSPAKPGPVRNSVEPQPQVVPITWRRDINPQLVQPAAGPAQKLHISLDGLLDKERVQFQTLLPENLDAVIVDDDSYNVLLLDTANPDAIRILRERIPDAVVVVVSNEQDHEMPGTVTMRRPLGAEAVCRTFAKVATMVVQRSETAGTSAGNSPVSHQTEEPTFTSLHEFAAAYRSGLAKAESVSVTIEGRKFSLYPASHLYKSSYSAEDLSAYRGRAEVPIEIANPGDPMGNEGSLGLSLRRLEEFLWHVGFNAGNGVLFPWISADSTYRLSRWPPVVRKDNDSTLVHLATLMAMARRTLRPADFAQVARVDVSIVQDFLNACSLVGCLEEFSKPPAVAPRPARAKNPFLSKLLGRIRLKLGIS